MTPTKPSLGPDNTPLVILHVPHAATAIPSETRDQSVLSDAELQDELRLMTDHYTDELFSMEHPLA